MLILKRLVGFLTSTRIGIVIMLILAVLSFLGAMIPQGGAHEAYLEVYGGVWGRTILALSLDDVFRTGYFTALLVLLCIMVFACSLRRLPQRIRSARYREFVFDKVRLSRMPEAVELLLDVDDEEAALHIADICRHHLYSVSAESGSGGRALFASKAGFSRYGSFVLHLSFIFLLFGGIVGARLGGRYYEEVRVGDVFNIPGPDGEVLPVAVEAFTVEVDERGRLSDYVCEVRYRHGDGPTSWFRIRPNHPFELAGRELYLVSYEEDPATPAGFVLAAYDSAGGAAAPHFFAAIDDPVYVEQLAATVQASIGVMPSLRLITDDGRVETYMIEDRPGRATGNQRYRFVLVHAVPSVLVVLEVVREPGQAFIMVGFALLTVGTFVSLYLSHRRIWFIVTKAPEGKASVTFGGAANRNRDGFSQEFEKIRSAVDELS